MKKATSGCDIVSVQVHFWPSDGWYRCSASHGHFTVHWGLLRCYHPSCSHNVWTCHQWTQFIDVSKPLGSLAETKSWSVFNGGCSRRRVTTSNSCNYNWIYTNCLLYGLILNTYVPLLQMRWVAPTSDTVFGKSPILKGGNFPKIIYSLAIKYEQHLCHIWHVRNVTYLLRLQFVLFHHAAQSSLFSSQVYIAQIKLLKLTRMS